jgi:zona occludens toxin
MAITVYAGKTGSGKSYNAIANVILPALKSGRTVVTNISVYKSEIFEEYPYANLITVPMTVDKSEVETVVNMANYPSGSVYVWDESGKMFPTGWKQNLVPPPVLTFFTEHRHSVSTDGYAGEIFLLCQDVSQLAKWIRDLVQQTYIHEKLDKHGLSDQFRVDIYDGPVATNRSKSVEKIDSKLGRYKDDIYRFYSSYTQSESITDTALEDNPDKRASYLGKYKQYALTVALGLPLSIWIFIASFNNMFGSDDLKNSQSVVVEETSNLVSSIDPKKLHKTVYETDLLDGYSTPDYYELSWSKTWRLTGVLKSQSRSYALISNRQRTRRVELYSNCYFERDNREYICFISGELVGSFTGPSFNESEDITGDVKKAFGVKRDL